MLAGGTMSPVRALVNSIIWLANAYIQVGDFHAQLFSYLPADKLVVYSCGHVVPKSNIKTVVLGKGPRGRNLEFKFSARGDEDLVCQPQFIPSHPRVLSQFL